MGKVQPKELAELGARLPWKDNSGAKKGNRGRIDKPKMFHFWFLFIAMFIDETSPLWRLHGGLASNGFTSKMTAKGILPTAIVRIGLMKPLSKKGFKGGHLNRDFCRYHEKDMTRLWVKFQNQLSDSNAFSIYGAASLLVGKEAATEICTNAGLHVPLMAPGSSLRRTASDTSVRTYSERDSSDGDDNTLGHGTMERAKRGRSGRSG